MKIINQYSKRITIAHVAEFMNEPFDVTDLDERLKRGYLVTDNLFDP